MPYSYKEHKELTKDWFQELLPDTVTDIGAGSGTYAKLFRPIKTGHWTAIEIFAPNETKFELRKLYDKVIISDVKYIDSQYLTADLAIAGDIIEHLPYEDARPVIEKILSRCDRLLISLPIIHYEQHEVGGNIYETHHYHWAFDEMKELLEDIGDVEKSQNGDTLGVFLVKSRADRG